MPTPHENLITAAKEGNNEKVIDLLKSGADLKASNQHGNTALIFAADKGHAAVVTALVEKGANPDRPNQYGDTALIFAAANGHAAVVTDLVQAGADLKASNQHGNTALHLAADKGHAAVVTALVQAGADLNASNQHGNTALIFAADKGHAAVVTALVQAGADPEALSQHGNTALIFAADKGHAAVVTALVQAGADLKASNQHGDTALIRAAIFGHAAVVTALLEKGADPKAKNQYGDTALHIAADKGHAAVVTALVQAGADPEALSQYGETALHYAEARAHAGIVVKIKKYIESGEYEWRQHLPRLRQAAREYNHPTTQSSVGGLTPEPELAETVSIESIADTLIPYFLHSISQPLAFAKLFNYRLPEASPVKDSCKEFSPIAATMLAAKPKIINPKIMENFAKIMAALSAFEKYKYKGGRPVVAKAIEDGILELTKLGEIFSSEGDIVGIEEVIKTLSDDDYAEVFKTTTFWGLTNLQKVISDVSEILGGENYSDRSSFVKLKGRLDSERKSLTVVAQTDSSSSNFFHPVAAGSGVNVGANTTARVPSNSRIFNFYPNDKL